MKIFEKIKDLFTDEIMEENEELIEIKKEVKNNELSFVRSKEKGANEEDNNFIVNDLLKEFDNLEVDNNSSNNFKFPISFEESDFLDNKILSNQNVMVREKDNEKHNVSFSSEPYQKKTKPEEKVTFFKVSPVISPVYGILDKNYKKEEVQSKTKTSKDIIRNKQKVDFESVRKKAYGSLIDDIKDNLSSVKIEDKNDKKEDFYKIKESIEEITLGDVETNFSDFGITIDDYKKEETKDEIVKIKTFEEDVIPVEVMNDFIDKKQSDDLEKIVTDDLNDDIFNLIDNMYDEKEEENDRC